MIEYKTKITRTEKIDDIVCDICGESCATGPYFRDVKEERKQKLCRITGKKYVPSDMHKNFEYLKMDAHWGYGSSGYDGEKWVAYICQKCVDKHLINLVNFNKRHGQFF